MDFGVIKSIEVTQNLDTGEQVRLAQVTILDEDVVTVEMPFPEGDEFVPAAGDRVYFEEADEGLLVARCIQTVMDVDESLGEGERELFSRDGTSRSATIRMKNDASIVMKDTVSVGNGDDPVATSWLVDAYIGVLDSMLTTLDGGILAGAYSAALGPSGLTAGNIPTSASANLSSDPEAPKVTP